jgi:hypothetical protein
MGYKRAHLPRRCRALAEPTCCGDHSAPRHREIERGCREHANRDDTPPQLQILELIAGAEPNQLIARIMDANVYRPAGQGGHLLGILALSVNLTAGVEKRICGLRVRRVQWVASDT